MQIPILNGIYTDEKSDFRISYPVNYRPTSLDTGISKGYLRPPEGIVSFGTGPGTDYGGIEWNGICYRVMGTNLISIDSSGSYTTIGDVGATEQVTFDYSFDYLAVAANNKLFLYDGTTLTQVTDSDLGVVKDVIWVDGYFMTTDGTFLVVTELNNPFSVNPLKYGSSEADPDKVLGLLKLRNEVYALNRHTIEVFENQGGDLFPFLRIEGAQIEKGPLGTHTACVFMEAIGFLGSGWNESPGVYLGAQGQAVKISTKEIDVILSSYSEADLSGAVCESFANKGVEELRIHLKDRVLVYNGTDSKSLGSHVWYILSSATDGYSTYRARNLVRCYDKWISGDPTTTNYGYFDDSISTHYGNKIGWQFGTVIVYNEGRRVIFNEMELVCLTGRVALGVDPTIYTQFSLDGETWSQPRQIKTGKQGQRSTRVAWLKDGTMEHWRMQRFKGDSDSHLSIARLEARVEGLL